MFSVEHETSHSGMIKALFAANRIPTENVGGSAAMFAVAGLTGSTGYLATRVQPPMLALATSDRSMACQTSWLIYMARVDVTIAATFALVERLMSLRKWPRSTSEKIGAGKWYGEENRTDSDRHSE